MLRFWDKHIAKNGPKRQKLSVQVFSNQHKSAIDQPVEDGVVTIRDPVEFKRTSDLFPLPKSVDVSRMTMKAALEADGVSQGGEYNS